MTTTGPGTALVTGCASGVGEAVTRRYVARGWNVVGVDLQEVSIEGVVAVRGDVANAATWDEVARVLGDSPVDALVGAAGQIKVKPILDTTADDLRELFDVNVVGVLRGIQLCIPRMVRRGGGSIVVVASVDATLVEPQMGAYCVSKGGLVQLVRAAALEHAHQGVRINGVCPGAVDTPLLRQHLESTGDLAAGVADIESATPTGKLISADEVAACIEFLASDAAGGVSGTFLTVDGGMTSTIAFDLNAVRA
ncbi:SDR family NAD(P)-dependent oxidoreductase [Prauserella endophytica]|uniref:SDR family oxidoreductase n=1 Tax=Prauserella endophytica TaxID=1592324 RepID=A0ABY2S7N4_9PSEU|nr:SDR family oxidoreductase [Prauserella endophytica]TKG71691.1 SDR family oxidoreductase [Prauserella endophytica]